jgi:ABC-type antimicrobial peptide transport system permease subunit
MRAVIGRGVAHTAAGVATGIAVAWPLAVSVEAFLFQVRPHDPVIYGAAAALLGICGIAAAIVPARRAARVNPVIAMRVE